MLIEKDKAIERLNLLMVRSEGVDPATVRTCAMEMIETALKGDKTDDR